MSASRRASRIGAIVPSTPGSLPATSAKSNKSRAVNSAPLCHTFLAMISAEVSTWTSRPKRFSVTVGLVVKAPDTTKIDLALREIELHESGLLDIIRGERFCPGVQTRRQIA